MTTDFRALCAELMEALDEAAPGINQFRDLRDRADAALADGPAVPAPTVMEIIKLSEEIEASGLGQVDFARAILARWGNPAPAPPADGEVAELVAEIRHFLAGYQKIRGLDPEHIYSIHRGDKMEAHITVSRLTRAAELLQRQATAYAICERERLHQSTRAADLEVERQAVPVPVPVSERLPGPEDCDAEGRCWAGTNASVDTSGDRDIDLPPSWELREVCAQDDVWLPANALPLPEVGVSERLPASEWHPVILRAAELLQRQVAWQPIDTAPRDGTEILARDIYAIKIVSWVKPRFDMGIAGEWHNREGQTMFPAWWQPLPDHPELPEVIE